MDLYIVHGWAYSIDKWSIVLQLLKENDITPHMLLVPGLTKKSNQSWTIEQYCNWLDGELAGINNPVVLGHSNGGRIAMNYDITHPGRLKYLILLDSAGIRNSSKIIAVKLFVLKILAKLLKPAKKIPGFSRVVHRAIGAVDYHDSPDNMKQTLRNMIDSDKKLNLSKVSVNTSLIWGENDSQTPLKDANTILKSIQHPEGLTVIKDARHAPYDTHPKELVSEILKVINKVGLK